MTVEDIVAAIVNGAEKKELTTLFKDNASSIRSQANRIFEALRTIVNPAENSLGYLYLLDGLANNLSHQNEEAFMVLAVGYLDVCKPSAAREAPEKFVNVCRVFKEILMKGGSERLGVIPLRTAISKLAPTPEHLTPVHADFLQICLLAKLYNSAVPILSQDVFDVDPVSTAMTPKDLLLYSYYGGMIHIGRRDYAKALDIFMLALTSPTHAVSAITMSVYKKYTLVSLIHKGFVSTLPKYASNIVQRSLRPECTFYFEIASQYHDATPGDLRAIANSHEQAITNDGNMGLMKAVIASKTKRSIQLLTQTFLTLPLTQIAQAASLSSAAEAELYILRMIDAGDIFAQIDEAQGMVRFLDDPQGYTSAAVVERLDSQIRASMALSEKLQSVHDQVSTDKSFMGKSMNRDRSSLPAFNEASMPDFAATGGQSLTFGK